MKEAKEEHDYWALRLMAREGYPVENWEMEKSTVTELNAVQRKCDWLERFARRMREYVELEGSDMWYTGEQE